MSAKDDLQRAIDRAIGSRLKTPRTWPALLGNIDGVVDIADRAGWVNVVMPDGTAASAYNGGRVPPIAGLPVVVGYDHLNPALFAVLSVRQNYQDGTPYPAGVGAHAKTHEWLQANGGYDVVYADARQFLPLRLDVAGMVLTVHTGYAMTESGWTLGAGQTVDLTASVPVSGAKWALLTLDEAGALTATLGSDGGSRLLLGPGQLPALPAHHRPLAGVKLYAGQTEIVESRDQQDLVDLRFAAQYTIAPIPTVDAIQFDTAAGVTPIEGEAAWDAVNGTLAIGMPGGSVTLQLGQEQLIRVLNDSGGALADGDLVYVSGASGTNIKVKKARADAESTSANTLGMATEAIASNQHGYITTFGVVHNVNTFGLTAGAILYLSPTTAGGFTVTKPTAPNHTVTVGVVVRVSATQGEVFVSVNNGYELDELHDVVISGSAAGDLLIAGSAGTWANHPLTGDASLTELGALTIVNGAITPAKTGGFTSGQITYGSAGSSLTSGSGLTTDGQQLRLPVSGSAGGVVIGGDTQVWRNDANELRTSDSLIIDLTGTVTGAGGALHVKRAGVLSRFERDVATPATFNDFYNPSTTDNNGVILQFYSDTTGSGSAALQALARQYVVFDVHDHATRRAYFAWWLANGGAVAEKMRLSGQGNLLLGGTSDPTSATKTITLSNGTAPASSPSAATSLYSALITSGSGTTAGFAGLHIRDETGLVHKFGRHATLPGGQQVAVRAVAANYTAQDTDYVLLCTGGSAGITVTLPAAANVSSIVAGAGTAMKLHIEKADVGAGVITVSGSAGELINGSTTKRIEAQYEALTIVCNGTGWTIL